MFRREKVRLASGLLASAGTKLKGELCACPCSAYDQVGCGTIKEEGRARGVEIRLRRQPRTSSLPFLQLLPLSTKPTRARILNFFYDGHDTIMARLREIRGERATELRLARRSNGLRELQPIFYLSPRRTLLTPFAFAPPFFHSCGIQVRLVIHFVLLSTRSAVAGLEFR